MAILDPTLECARARRPSQAQMVGEAPVYREMERALAQVAPTDVTVLLEGESGSGKSAAARFLHDQSARSGGPFVEVALPALPPTLIESELFGHEAGAFTGAVRARSGRFMRAHTGTLVLDAVECLPESLQLKLLRVIQERTVETLGAGRPVSVDVRIVATTSVDLRTEVALGRFRSDLYFRLAVVCIRVPALRVRASDIPILCRAVIEKRSALRGLAAREFEPAALERLCAHPWPGNVRELENTIERVLVLTPRNESAASSSKAPPPIRVDELDFLDEATRGVPERLAQAALAHGVSLVTFERALLEEALRTEHGNRAAAARRVGLSRRAFDYRLSQQQRDAAASDADSDE